MALMYCNWPLYGHRNITRPRFAAVEGERTALPGPVHWGHGQGRADCAVCCSWYGYKLWKTELFPDAAAAAVGGELVDRSELAEVLHVITWTSLPISYTYMPAVIFTAATTCSCCCSWPNLLIIQHYITSDFNAIQFRLVPSWKTAFSLSALFGCTMGHLREKRHFKCIILVYFIKQYNLFYFTLIHNYTSDNMLRTVFMPQCSAVNLVYHLFDVYVG